MLNSDDDYIVYKSSYLLTYNILKSDKYGTERR